MKLTDLHENIITGDKDPRDLLVIVKTDKGISNSNLGILNREMFHIIKLENKGDGHYVIHRYDRDKDSNFRGFSYLDLGNVETVGDERFIRISTPEPLESIAHKISIITGVSLDTNVTKTDINRLSAIVKDTYTLLDDCVVVNILPSKE